MASPEVCAVPGGGHTPSQLRRNWTAASVLVGINHGAVTTPLVFATTLLDKDVGYAGSATLYVCTCLGSLFVSVPLVIALGHRRGLVLSMFLYSVYVGTFAFAAAMPMGSAAQWGVFLPGSCIGGVAASLLWTCQGGYLDRSITAICAAEGEGSEARRREETTTELTSTFAMYYLLFEVVFKLSSSLALRYKIAPWLIFVVGLGIAAASTFAAVTLLDLGRAGPVAGPKPRAVAKLLKAIALWSDPVLWCLSLTNLTFGFCAAFMNGYVNLEYTKVQLGASYVGFYATATALTAAVMSRVFGAAVNALGSKGPAILVGSLCFLLIPLLVITLGFEGWGYLLIVPYILQGCGRAVYESTAKAAFADFFPGEKSEGAFANVMMQATLSFGFCFFFSAVLSRAVLASVVLGLAGLTFPMYALARWLRRKTATSDEDTSRNDASESEGSSDT